MMFSYAWNDDTWWFYDDFPMNPYKTPCFQGYASYEVDFDLPERVT